MNFEKDVVYELTFIYTGKDYNLDLHKMLIKPKSMPLRINPQTYINFVFGHDDFDEGFVVIYKEG